MILWSGNGIFYGRLREKIKFNPAFGGSLYSPCHYIPWILWIMWMLMSIVHSTLPGSPASVCKAHCSLATRPRPSSEPGPSGHKCWRRCWGRDREASHLNIEWTMLQKLSSQFRETLGKGSLKRNEMVFIYLLLPDSSLLECTGSWDHKDLDCKHWFLEASWSLSK